MPSSYTPSLRLTLPATGELTGTWGVVVNTGITELLDSAVAGTTTISTWGGAGVPYTLSNTDGAADEARRMFIVASGAPGEAKNVICPAVSKLYFFRNDTTGGFALTLKTSGGSGIAVPAGQYKVLYCNGTNVVEAFNSLASLTLGTALAVTSGGTGTTTSTGTGSVVLSNSPTLVTPALGTPASGVLTNATGLPVSTGISGLGAGVATFLATPSSANLAAAVTDETGTGALVFATSPAFTTPNLGTPSAATLTNATGLPLTTGVTGTLPAANGGTGQSTYAVGDLVYATGTTALSKLGIGTNGQILTSSGTAPQWSTLSGVAVTTFSAGTTGFTPSTATSGAVTLAGTLATTNGGTGLTSFTSGGVVYASSSSALATGSALAYNGTTLTADTASTTAANFRIENGTYNRVGSFRLTTDGVQFDAFDQNSTSAQRSFMWLSGGSEQMRLTSTGLGIGTSSPGQKLDVSGVDGVRARVIATSGGTPGLILSSAGNVAYTIKAGNADNSLRIDQDGTDRITLASGGNVGIGTPSPGVRLDVSGGSIRTTSWVDITPSTATSNALYRSTNTGGTFYSGIDNSAGGVTGTGYAGTLWHTGAYPIAFGTSNALRMTLDASGNLGLGITPSAWGAPYTGALQLKNGASFTNNQVNNAHFGINARYDGTNWRYIGTNIASRYEQFNGGHFWFTAPSGTAGNAISFTQAMTLDASGNLGVGTTSPTSRIHALGTIQTITGSSGIQIYGDGGSGYVNSLGANPLVFQVNSTERARITSGGDLLVGTTTGTGSSTANGLVCSGTTPGYVISRRTSGAVQTHIAFVNGGTTVGDITSSTTATTYSTSSDYRLKDNPQPLTNSGAFIDALQPKTWNWKIDGSKGVGFIAHEAQAVSPSSVVGEKDAVDADGKPVMQAMEYGSAEFIANIIAELQSLRARVAALESQP